MDRNKIDAVQRRQIIFMDRDDILNLYVVTNLPVPETRRDRLRRECMAA